MTHLHSSNLVRHEVISVPDSQQRPAQRVYSMPKSSATSASMSSASRTETAPVSDISTGVSSVMRADELRHAPPDEKEFVLRPFDGLTGQRNEQARVKEISINGQRPPLDREISRGRQRYRSKDRSRSNRVEKAPNCEFMVTPTRRQELTALSS